MFHSRILISSLLQCFPNLDSRPGDGHYSHMQRLVRIHDSSTEPGSASPPPTRIELLNLDVDVAISLSILEDNNQITKNAITLCKELLLIYSENPMTIENLCLLTSSFHPMYTCPAAQLTVNNIGGTAVCE